MVPLLFHKHNIFAKGRVYMNHLEFEKKLIFMLLAGNDDNLELLRKQFANSAVASRDISESGFFTEFKTGRKAKPLHGNPSLEIGDIDGVVDGQEGSVGFVLFIRDGYIYALEGYTAYLDIWPEEYENIDLVYLKKEGNLFVKTDARDMDALRELFENS